MSRKRASAGESGAMPCAAAPSRRIHASVRPASGTPLKALRMPKISSKARDIARPPAPPVSTSVPSMSKRIRVAACRSALAANVAGAGAFRGRLFFEGDALSFIQLVEATLHRAAVKEPLLPGVVTNKTEPSITNESLDRTTGHPSLLGRARMPKAFEVSKVIPDWAGPKTQRIAERTISVTFLKFQSNTGVYKPEAGT